MECLENLDLRGTAMRDPLLVMKNLKRLSFRGSVAKPSTCIGNGIAAWGLVLSSLHHLCSLTKLDLSDCNIGEGAIPHGISDLSSLDGYFCVETISSAFPQALDSFLTLTVLNCRGAKGLSNGQIFRQIVSYT
ncbi:hypothetical protein Prudu_021113 [Prunus dulcis]|uniref:RNI-like superfamily protein n=1 Tax=Prunus dulcis TaxID=3755 RepID=A0A4Y1RWT9_PRUDU|nr:hypothetical protein Prudu_021113 [Prunus dulcis]